MIPGWRFHFAFASALRDAMPAMLAGLLVLTLFFGCATVPVVAPSVSAMREKVTTSRITVERALAAAQRGDDHAAEAVTRVATAQQQIVEADQIATALDATAPQFHREFADLKFRFRVALRELSAAQAQLTKTRDAYAVVVENLHSTQAELAAANTRADELQTHMDARAVNEQKLAQAASAAELSETKAKARSVKLLVALVTSWLLIAGFFIARQYVPILKLI